MLLIFGVGNAWAEEVSIDFSQKNYSNQQAITDVTITEGINAKFEKGSNSNPPKYYTSGTAIRAYGGNTFTISSTIGNITQIDLTFGSSDGSNAITTDAGNFSSPTWTGDANSVKFTIAGSSGNRRIKAIKVTYTPSTGGGEDSGEGGGEDPVDPIPGAGGTVTYTVSSVTEVSTTGNVPQGSTAVLSGTGSLNSGFIQCTNGKNHTLTLTGYEGYMITGVTIHVKSNSSKGTGSFSVMAGSTAIASITESAFNTSSWNGSWNTTGVDKTLTMTNDSYEIQSGENVTLTINCKSGSSNYNSLYVKSYTITYIPVTSSGGGTEETVPSLTQDQFSWSATTATATLPNTFDNPPTLTNKASLAVSYSSSKEDVATIGENGNVTLVGKGETIISATAGDDETYKKTTVSYTLTVKPAPLAPIAGGVIDILNQDWTDVTGTNYTDVAAKTAENEGHSNAQYVAQCAGDKSSIQLRSNNNNSGVVSTISGGIVKRVEVEWQNETTAGRILQVYGSNTAYEAATDLYSDDKKGELLGEITMGGDETVVDYSQWTGDYKYIGFRSKSGAMYLTTITITWLPINSKVTIDGAIQNGSINVSGVADLNAVAAGTVLTLDNTPKAGYKFVKYNVYKTDEPTTEIDVDNSKFTMPEYDVTVSATFTSIKELDKIEVNTTDVKKTFWQGEAFSSNGLEVTAYYTDGTSAEVTPTNITGGNTANAGEITVTVSYTEGSNTKTTTYSITVKAIENNETTVYTVAQAREIIDAVGNTTVEVYVQGIVSKIVTAFNPNYGNISYDISADGLKTSDQLQAYRGFSYDGAWFTSADDIQVGDVVIVKGKLKIHNTTYELDEGNQLVKLERSDEPMPTAATLPFEFDGNKDDIADVVGMSQTGLGNYNTSPKLKFDDENDNVIIHFDSEPGEFSFALKQNGQNAGMFTVYESVDGEDYTSVWSGGNLGNGQTSTIESTLSSTARYVKFELTTKGSSTNYGLGQISIKKIDKRQEAGLAWNPATVSLTVGDAFTAPTLSNPHSVSGITYKSSNEDVATVSADGVIALVDDAVGTATITATFADGDATYKPATVTCTITVNPKTETVVILAQYNGQWYALKNVEETAGKVLAALPVNYVGGKLYNVEEADKATIEWQRAAVTDGIIFKNGENYIYGTAGSTDLKLSTTECAWTLDGSTYKIGNRTFIYRAQANGFKNYNATTTPGTDDYSNLPVVTAPVYATGDAYGRSVNLGEDGYRYGTICLPFGSKNFTGAEFFECVGSEPGKVYLGSVTELEAGVPYIFQATATELAVYSDGTTAATPGNSNGLYGTFTDETPVAAGNYILLNNELRPSDGYAKVNANRAYLVMGEVPADAPQQMPGRRYIGMSVQGENEATGFDNIQLPNANSQKLIINGQLIIIRNGEKFNAQGIKL